MIFGKAGPGSIGKIRLYDIVPGIIFPKRIQIFF